MFTMIITAMFLSLGQIGQVGVTGIPSMEECEAAIPVYRENLENEARAAGHTPGVDFILEFQCVPG